MIRSRYAALLPYLSATALVVVAVLGRAAFDPHLRNRQPFAAFLIAVLLASRYCGFRPALLAVVLSASASRYFFVPPRYSFALPNSIEAGSLVFFVVFGFLCAWIIRGEQRAKRKLELEIAERARIDEKLRLRESQLSSILDHTPVVIFLKDSEGRYLITNSTYQTIIQHTGGTVVGKSDRELFPPEIAERFRAFDAQVWRDQVPVSCEEIAPHADGPHTYRSIKFPVRDASGRMIALGGISIDISDLKTARESLEQERELLRNLIEVQEKERQFLCHEFHDGLIQYTVAALMSLEHHQDRNPNSDASKLLVAVVSNLRRGVEDGRRVIRGIRPAVLDDFGIEAAIEDLIGQFADSEIMVTSKCDPDIGRVSDSIQTTLYRVVQEALSNSRKHSGTDVVRIELKKVAGVLQLDIHDFGCGFDLEAARNCGFGLLGMTERVRLLGGECVIRSEREVGTHVSVRVPIHEPAANLTLTT